MNETDWSRLGDLVKRRREELRLTQGQVQEQGGPSPALVRALENKRTDTLSPSKRRDLERALGWFNGSVDDILAGGEPTPTRHEIPLFDPDNMPPGLTQDTTWPLPLKLSTVNDLLEAGHKAKKEADDAEGNGVDAPELISATRDAYTAIVAATAETFGGVEAMRQVASALSRASELAHQNLAREKKYETQSETQTPADPQTHGTARVARTPTTRAGKTGAPWADARNDEIPTD